MLCRISNKTDNRQAIHRKGRIPLAMATGRAIPVPAATHAAMQSGHLGNRTAITPASAPPVGFHQRRALQLQVLFTAAPSNDSTLPWKLPVPVQGIDHDGEPTTS